MRKLPALFASLLLFSAALIGQSFTQDEVVLTIDPVQEVTPPWYFTLSAPAVRVGDSIYIGYLRPSDGGGTGPSCHRFYFLQDDDLLPDDALEFVSVVVGVGGGRGYLWYGGLLRGGESSGAAPKLRKA